MQKFIVINKKIGETPLELIERVRAEKPELKDQKMTYAGRLDPMAEGEMLILIGQECKNKDKYLGLDKEYITEIIFGLGTDTDDLLGIYEETGNKDLVNINQFKVKEVVERFKGKISQSEPRYASRNIKKDFEKLHDGVEIDSIPKEVTLYESEIIDFGMLNKDSILDYVKENIPKVNGDFRQKEIINTWEKTLRQNGDALYPILKIRLNVSSGFYVRSFARDIGKALGVSALTKSIYRTKIFL